MASVALILGLLLALLIGLLAVPLSVVFRIHRIKKTRGLVRFRWLFGLVRIQLRMPRPAHAAGRKGKSPRRKQHAWRAGRLFSLIRQPAFRRRVYRFIRDVLRATHARNLSLRLRIGLGDPADTGRLWAVIGPVAGMAQNLRGATIRIDPDFVEPIFAVESHGRFRLVPIQFIALTVAFVLSPTVLRAWLSARRGNA